MIPDIRITIWGMQQNDPTVMDSLKLPTEIEPYREPITKAILLNSIPLECIYPNPEFFKQALETFSEMQAQSWLKIFKVAMTEYNPLSDRVGWIKENENTKDNGSSTTYTKQEDSATNEMKTSTFETGAYNNRNRTETTGNSASGGSSAMDSNRDRGLQREFSLSTGMRSIQDNLEKELELIPKINFIDIIAMDVVRRFNVMVY